MRHDVSACGSTHIFTFHAAGETVRGEEWRGEERRGDDEEMERARRDADRDERGGGGGYNKSRLTRGRVALAPPFQLMRDDLVSPPPFRPPLRRAAGDATRTTRHFHLLGPVRAIAPRRRGGRSDPPKLSAFDARGPYTRNPPVPLPFRFTFITVPEIYVCTNAV